MKKGIFLQTLLFFLLMGVVSAKAVSAAPRIYLDPSSGNYNSGTEFSVKVKIDTDGRAAMAADALVNFDSTRLEVKQVATGGFFSGFDYNISNSNGRITIYSFAEQALQTRTGTGDLATVTFKAIASGTATVSFLCQAGSNSDSAIWDSTGNDLIDCASNGSGSYVIGSSVGGTSPTNTPAPETTTAPDAPTPTPSQLPETGIETPILGLLIGGGIMMLLGLAVVL